MWFKCGWAALGRGVDGIWGYLTSRTNARKAIELEKERNRGTESAIKALPLGARLLENEPDGRLRVITMPSQVPPPRPTIIEVINNDDLPEALGDRPEDPPEDRAS